MLMFCGDFDINEYFEKYLEIVLFNQMKLCVGY